MNRLSTATSTDHKSKLKRSIQFCWDETRVNDYHMQFKSQEKGKTQNQQLSAKIRILQGGSIKIRIPFSLTQKTNQEWLGS